MPDEATPPTEVMVATLLEHAIRFGRPPDALATELRTRLDLTPLLRARAGELSRGERRRVALFGAICAQRPVIVLDEPFGAFDPQQLLDVLAVVRSRAAAGSAVIVSVHQMSDAEKIADRVLLLRAGRVLAFDTLAGLRARVEDPTASLEEVFLALLGAKGSEHAPA
jgi:ABC-2 type transport system ATP-binding protein